MVKEQLMDRETIYFKEMLYFVFLFFTLAIISSIIETIVRFFISYFEISCSMFCSIYLIFVFYFLVVNKVRIGFLENLVEDNKKYKKFKVWFQ